MIRVAVADDSPFTCRLVSRYLEEGGECEVAGVAHDAAATLDVVRRTRPDVLTLDLGMPGCAGLDLLRQLVREFGLPIVVISGVTRHAAATTLRALDAGAVDVVLKHTPGAPVRPDTLRREIVHKVRTAALAARVPEPAPVVTEAPTAPTRAFRRPPRRLDARPLPSVIVIGASTGGPQAVREVLAQLPSDFATPCVVVQHLPAAFTEVFAEELSRYTKVPVREAASGDRLEPGRAVVAPGAIHLVVGPRGRIELRAPADGDLHRPSIDIAMTSAARSFGPSACGVVLTGMGSDGAEGLREIRESGGDGYVQDPASCIVASMPRRAIERAGADCVATPQRIGHLLAARRIA